MAEVSKQSYLERITKGKEEKDKEAAIAAAQDAKIQVEADLMSAKREVSKAKSELNAAKNSIPFDSGDVLEAQRTLSEVEADVTALQSIKEELFGDVKLD